MSVPPGTEMFQFPGFASTAYVFSCRYPSRGGLPHSDIHGSTPARGSPWLFAACHVLHRLLVPRHPPNALLALEIRRQDPPGRSPKDHTANPPCTGASHTQDNPIGIPRTRRPAARQARTQHTHGIAPVITPADPNAAERFCQAARQPHLPLGGALAGQTPRPRHVQRRTRT